MKFIFIKIVTLAIISLFITSCGDAEKAVADYYADASSGESSSGGGSSSQSSALKGIIGYKMVQTVQRGKTTGSGRISKRGDTVEYTFKSTRQILGAGLATLPTKRWSYKSSGNTAKIYLDYGSIGNSTENLVFTSKYAGTYKSITNLNNPYTGKVGSVTTIWGTFILTRGTNSSTGSSSSSTSSRNKWRLCTKTTSSNVYTSCTPKSYCSSGYRYNSKYSSSSSCSRAASSWRKSATSSSSTTSSSSKWRLCTKKTSSKVYTSCTQKSYCSSGYRYNNVYSSSSSCSRAASSWRKSNASSSTWRLCTKKTSSYVYTSCTPKSYCSSGYRYNSVYSSSSSCSRAASSWRSRQRSRSRLAGVFDKQNSVITDDSWLLCANIDMLTINCSHKKICALEDIDLGKFNNEESCTNTANLWLYENSTFTKTTGVSRESLIKSSSHYFIIFDIDKKQ